MAVAYFFFNSVANRAWRWNVSSKLFLGTLSSSGCWFARVNSEAELLMAAVLLLLLEAAFESLEKSSGGTDVVGLVKSALAPSPVVLVCTPNSGLPSRPANERCRAVATEPATRRVDCHCGGTTFAGADTPLSTLATEPKFGCRAVAELMTGIL